MIITKFLGCFAVFLSCVLFGFYKSFELKSRKKLLKKVYLGMKTLKDGIKYSNKELSYILKSSFKDCKEIIVINNKGVLQKNCLKKCDRELINEFFSSLGVLDKESECGRIELYINLVNEGYKKAFEEEANGVKFWQTVGFCTGLGLCIFLI